MKRSTVGPLVLATLALAGLAAIAEAQPKNRFAGRVAGLAVSVLNETPSGDGKEVEFQVDMTTIRVARRSRGALPLNNFSPSEFNTSTLGLGGLGDADLRLRQSATDPAGRSFSNFQYGLSYMGDALYVMASFGTQVEGELPALSFGDGATIDATTLSPNGSPTTTTPNGIPLIRSRWRATFTHTYADGNAYTVRAASRCCQVEADLGDDDVEEQRGALLSTLFTGNRVYPVYSSLQDLTFGYRDVVRAGNVASVRGPAIVTTTRTMVRSDSETGVASSFQLFYPLGQVTNTVRVEEGFGAGVLEVPTASTYGLGLLSLLLAGLGFVALRNGR